MAFVKLATITSSIKGFHVYRTSPDIGKKLKFVLEETNRHTNTAIKDANETIGHIPDGLSKVVAPALNKEIVLSVDAEDNKTDNKLFFLVSRCCFSALRQ